MPSLSRLWGHLRSTSGCAPSSSCRHPPSPEKHPAERTSSNPSPPGVAATATSSRRRDSSIPHHGQTSGPTDTCHQPTATSAVDTLSMPYTPSLSYRGSPPSEPSKHGIRSSASGSPPKVHDAAGRPGSGHGKAGSKAQPGTCHDTGDTASGPSLSKASIKIDPKMRSHAKASTFDDSSLLPSLHREDGCHPDAGTCSCSRSSQPRNRAPMPRKPNTSADCNTPDPLNATAKAPNPFTLAWPQALLASTLHSPAETLSRSPSRPRRKRHHCHQQQYGDQPVAKHHDQRQKQPHSQHPHRQQRHHARRKQDSYPSSHLDSYQTRSHHTASSSLSESLSKPIPAGC